MNTIMNVIKSHKSICWYPSAGSDFRPLIFLNTYAYDFLEIPKEDKQVFPDLFIMTDIAPEDVNWSSQFIYDRSKNISRLKDPLEWKNIHCLFHESNETSIDVKHVEKLASISIPPAFFSVKEDFLKKSKSYYGSVFLFDVVVSSKRKKANITDTWNTTILYVLTENVSFAKEILLKNHIKVDYVTAIRYGEGFGGSNIHANWIRNILGALKCKYYICDLQYEYKENTLPYFEDVTLPEISLSLFKILPSYMWSNRGDIGFYKVEEVGRAF